jgi:hypothetical protein
MSKQALQPHDRHGRARLQRPNLERWEQGDHRAWESPPLLAGVRRAPGLSDQSSPSTADRRRATPTSASSPTAIPGKAGGAAGRPMAGPAGAPRSVRAVHAGMASKFPYNVGTPWRRRLTEPHDVGQSRDRRVTARAPVSTSSASVHARFRHPAEVERLQSEPFQADGSKEMRRTTPGTLRAASARTSLLHSTGWRSNVRDGHGTARPCARARRSAV